MRGPPATALQRQVRLGLASELSGLALRALVLHLWQQTPQAIFAPRSDAYRSVRLSAGEGGGGEIVSLLLAVHSDNLEARPITHRLAAVASAQGGDSLSLRLALWA